MSDLRITAVEAHVVEGDRPWTVVRIETDAGLRGVGEARFPVDRYGLAPVERIGRELVGADPFETERHLSARGVTGLSGASTTNALGTAIAGAIDVACWDVKGRHLGVPVYDLLGGRIREDLPAYANGWDWEAREVVSAYHDGGDPETVLDETTEAIAAAAAEVAAAGYEALKFSPFQWGDGPTTSRRELEFALEVVAAVDGAVGPEVDLLVEGHKHLSVDRAIEAARRLARFDPRFYEEPVHVEVGALRRVARASPVPIATGEELATHRAFEELLASTEVGIVQPDVSRVGGITALKKVAAMASAARVGFAPHNAAGPVMTAAAAHVDVTEPAFAIQETFDEFSHPDWTDDLLGSPLAIEDGRIRVPDRPGLGVELDLDAVREREVTDRYR